MKLLLVLLISICFAYATDVEDDKIINELDFFQNLEMVQNKELLEIKEPVAVEIVK